MAARAISAVTESPIRNRKTIVIRPNLFIRFIWSVRKWAKRFWWLTRVCVYPALLLAFSTASYFAGCHIKETVPAWWEEKRAQALSALSLQEARATEMAKDETTQKLIDRLAREQGVSPVLILAMAYQESSKKLDPDAKRFEPKVWKRFNLPDTIGGRLSATSLGLLQVIPAYHVGKGKSCDRIIAREGELFDREKNIRCGIAAFKACLARNKGDFRGALVCYNGGEEYMRIVTGNLANLAVTEFHLLPAI